MKKSRLLIVAFCIGIFFSEMSAVTQSCYPDTILFDADNLAELRLCEPRHIDARSIPLRGTYQANSPMPNGLRFSVSFNPIDSIGKLLEIDYEGVDIVGYSVAKLNDTLFLVSRRLIRTNAKNFRSRIGALAWDNHHSYSNTNFYHPDYRVHFLERKSSDPISLSVYDQDGTKLPIRKVRLYSSEYNKTSGDTEESTCYLLENAEYTLDVSIPSAQCNRLLVRAGLIEAYYERIDSLHDIAILLRDQETQRMIYNSKRDELYYFPSIFVNDSIWIRKDYKVMRHTEPSQSLSKTVAEQVTEPTGRILSEDSLFKSQRKRYGETVRLNIRLNPWRCAWEQRTQKRPEYRYVQALVPDKIDVPQDKQQMRYWITYTTLTRAEMMDPRINIEIYYPNGVELCIRESALLSSSPCAELIDQQYGAGTSTREDEIYLSTIDTFGMIDSSCVRQYHGFDSLGYAWRVVLLGHLSYMYRNVPFEDTAYWNSVFSQWHLTDETDRSGYRLLRNIYLNGHWWDRDNYQARIALQMKKKRYQDYCIPKNNMFETFCKNRFIIYRSKK